MLFLAKLINLIFGVNLLEGPHMRRFEFKPGAWDGYLRWDNSGVQLIVVNRELPRVRYTWYMDSTPIPERHKSR